MSSYNFHKNCTIGIFNTESVFTERNSGTKLSWVTSKQKTGI